MRLIVLGILVISLMGCSQLSLPQITPGERIIVEYQGANRVADDEQDRRRGS